MLDNPLQDEGFRKALKLDVSLCLLLQEAVLWCEVRSTEYGIQNGVSKVPLATER